MSTENNSAAETLKQQAIKDFHDHVSSGKVRFWQQYDMNLVMGKRQGPFFLGYGRAKKIFQPAL
jgi:hypothetical protein